MTHFKISRKELELFVTSMKVYETKIDEEHPHSDTYPFSHEISKYCSLCSSISFA